MILTRLFIVLVLMVNLCAPAWAVRPTSTISSFVDPSLSISMIARGGHRIGGGVFFDGTMEFILEKGDVDTSINVGDLKLVINQNLKILIRHQEVEYSFENHPLMTCPMMRFVSREAELAFSLPELKGPEAEARLNEAGLVEVAGMGMWVAKEFYSFPLVWLLHQTDFADVEHLEPKISGKVLSTLNSGLKDASKINFSRASASFFNIDTQVKYQMFLNKPSRVSEASGVPLRYYWYINQDEETVVNRVDIFSQKMDTQKIANLESSPYSVTQVDYITVYHTAALLRAFWIEDKVAFDKLIAVHCN